jgi:hypothetical protein
MFNKFNLTSNGSIIESSFVAFLEKVLTDPEWNAIAKEGFHVCINEMKPLVDDFQKLSTFTKEQCEMTFTTVFNCISFRMCSVSFQLNFKAIKR